MTAADAWDEREGPEGPDFEPIVPVRKPKRGKGLLYAVAAIVVLGASGAAGWYLWGDSLLMDPDAEIPLVRADGGPIKVRPESPGGMDIPDRDKLVYDRIDGNGERPEVERLLPPPETPKPLPAPAAGAQPAEQPAAGGEAPPQTTEVSPAPPTQLVPEKAPEGAQPSAPPPAPPASEPAPTVAEVLSTMRPPPPPDKAETTAAPAPAAPAETAVKEEPKPASAPAPAPEAAPKPEPKPLETAAAPATAETAGEGYRIQLAAVRAREAVEPEWTRLQKKNADLLGPLELSVQKADLGPGKGIYYRLQAGPLATEAAARDLCAKLKERKVGCLVVRPKG